MTDAPRLRAHRTAVGMSVKRGRGRLIGRTKGGLNAGPQAPAPVKACLSGTIRAGLY